MDFLNAIYGYRIERWLFLHHLKGFAWLVRCLIYLFHSSYIPYTCEIGENTKLAYKGIGCVIHSRAKIGRNCLIGTGVTIGGRSGFYEVPIIGDDVVIATGAKILGPIKIGNNAVIGANAVVITDVPENSIWGGVPARKLKDNEEKKRNDYSL